MGNLSILFLTSICPTHGVHLTSALFYTLAFNVVFFLQEVFLVLPKALTPNLFPILFHNNHSWTGENPLAHLFQGTGAMAILLIGLASLWWLGKRMPQTIGGHLFLIWMAYLCLFESLPQVVVGAFLPQNDVGMAMDNLELSSFTMNLAALIALTAIISAGIWLAHPLVELGAGLFPLDSPGERACFIFQVATLPALMSILLILLFRIPGSIDQVLVVPIAVTWIGISWIQASAWWSTSVPLGVVNGVPPIQTPLAVLFILLLFFQVVLRPGIAFSIVGN